MSCRCEALGPLQSPAHAAHSRAEQAVRKLGELSRNVQEATYSFRRRREPDPMREQMLEQHRRRMQEMHEAARRYLPEPDLTQFIRRSPRNHRQPNTQGKETDHG